MKNLSIVFRQAGSEKIDPMLVFLWLGLIGLVVVWVAPFAFIFFTSIKSNAYIMGTSAFALPTSADWSNYSEAWQKGNFKSTFFNSALISFIKVPLGLVFSSLAAYALARMKFRGSRAIFIAMVLGTMIPFQVMLAPLFSVVNSLGLLNTYVGVILPYLAFGVPYQVYVLHGFFKDIPKELSEAALIDGASHFTIYRRIFMPASLPVLAALLILDFVATWNEFAMALVLLQDSGKWTLPLGLMVFQGAFSSNYGQLNAAIIMTVMPAVLVYMIFQRYFVSGMTSGAVKE